MESLPLSRYAIGLALHSFSVESTNRLNPITQRNILNLFLNVDYYGKDS